MYFNNFVKKTCNEKHKYSNKYIENGVYRYIYREREEREREREIIERGGGRYGDWSRIDIDGLCIR